MRTCTRSLALTLLALAVGFAPTAEAGVAQYSGSLVIEAFANDTTTGSSYPFSINVFLGHPFGLFCNANYGPGSTACGGYSTPAQAGSPLTGSGSASVTGSSPATFTLPQSGLARKLGTPATLFVSKGKAPAYAPVHCWQTSTPGCGTPGGSFSAYFPYIYSYSYADLKNSKGNFFAGGGPGDFNYIYSAPKQVARLTVKQGANRFGGTMKLLGQFFSYGAYYRNGGLSIGAFSWSFDKVGAQGNYSSGGALTAPYTHSQSFTLKHTVLMQTATSTVKAVAVGWTTGTVTVTATARGPFPSHQQRKGADNRTAKGLGSIQLVSPLLTHWIFPGNDTETGGVGILKLTFVPEPEKWMMLAAGVSLLGILYRTHRRSD